MLGVWDTVGSHGIAGVLGQLGSSDKGFERAHVSPVTRAERDPGGYAPGNLKSYLVAPECRIDVSEP